MSDQSVAWDGVPENPEQDGWHWLVPKAGWGSAWPALWLSGEDERRGRDGQDRWDWAGSDMEGATFSKHVASGAWTYGGPCLRRGDSETGGAEAVLRACAGLRAAAATLRRSAAEMVRRAEALEAEAAEKEQGK